MNVKITENQKSEIVEKYENDISIKELAIEYNVHITTIQRILKSKGIKLVYRGGPRRHLLNEHFFDIIDNEEKAYILGFLCADGYNSEEDYSIKIELHTKDIDILQKIAKSCGSTSPIRVIKRKRKKIYSSCILKMCSKHMSQQLAKLGCVQAKSLILKFPTEDQVPKYLLKHFIRGYFDGDGCIGIQKEKNSFSCLFTLTSSVYFCDGLKSFIHGSMNIQGAIYDIKAANKLTKVYSVSSKPNSFNLIDWMYKDSTIYLDRKFIKYSHLKQLIINDKYTENKHLYNGI